MGEEGLAVNKIKHNAHCMEEMVRLREECLINFQLPSLCDLQEDFNCIYFLNCQSFIGKENALKNDFNVKGSLVAGFVDTHLSTGETIEEFGNFGYQYQLADDERPSLGISVFSKIETDDSRNFIYRNNKNEKVGSCMVNNVKNMFSLGSSNKNLAIIFCYVTPNCPKEIYNQIFCDIDEYLGKIRSEHCVVLGDFNRNPEEIFDVFGSKLMQKGLKQLISEKTHDHGKRLDHLYSNLDEGQIKYGVLESLTNTDHRPIFIAVKKVHS